MNRILLDVREPLEYKLGHAKGALNIPVSRMTDGVPDELAATSKDTEIVLYCMSGARSSAAIDVLRQYGFTNLHNGVNKSQVAKNYP